MIDGSQFLKEFSSKEPHLALLLQQMIEGINGTAQHIGINPNGKMDPPPPVDALDIKAFDGTVQATITHNQPIQKNIKYFVEAARNPSFDGAHVEELGSSRGKFFPLPGLDDDGNPINWHFRAYAQYHGSVAGQKTNFGPKYAPTAVPVGGAAQFTPTPSTGSGTAAPNGQQAGKGLGTDLERAPLGPLRGAGQSTL